MTRDEKQPPYPEGVVPSIRRVMMPRDTNAVGTIFGGVILSEIDLAAAIEAHKNHYGKLVTVGMNQIQFHQPVFVGDLVSFYTCTERIGTTSITVSVSVWSDRRFSNGARVFVTEAQVTLVAVDEDGRKIPVQRRPDAVLAEGCGRSPSKSAKSKAAQRTKPRKGESAAKSRKRKLEP